MLADARRRRTSAGFAALAGRVRKFHDDQVGPGSVAGSSRSTAAAPSPTSSPVTLPVGSTPTRSCRATRGVRATRRCARFPKSSRASPAAAPVDSVRLGTTVATNALLERKGEPTAAGDDARLRRRAAHRLPEPPRHLRARDTAAADAVRHGDRGRRSASTRPARCWSRSTRRPCSRRCRAARAAGLGSVAIAFLHGLRNPDHERRAAAPRRAGRIRGGRRVARSRPAHRARRAGATRRWPTPTCPRCSGATCAVSLRELAALPRPPATADDAEQRRSRGSRTDSAA